MSYCYNCVRPTYAVVQMEWDDNKDGLISWEEALQEFNKIFLTMKNDSRDHWVRKGEYRVLYNVKFVLKCVLIILDIGLVLHRLDSWTNPVVNSFGTIYEMIPASGWVRRSRSAFKSWWRREPIGKRSWSRIRYHSRWEEVQRRRAHGTSNC